MKVWPGNPQLVSFTDCFKQLLHARDAVWFVMVKQIDFVQTNCCIFKSLTFKTTFALLFNCSANSWYLLWEALTVKWPAAIKQLLSIKNTSTGEKGLYKVKLKCVWFCFGRLHSLHLREFSKKTELHTYLTKL